MTIAISAVGSNLDSEVDPRFGRCAYLVIVDPETLEFEAVKNPNVAHASGAGIATAQLVADRGVEMVCTGSLGPKASQTLSAAGIQMVTGVGGSVRDVVEGYIAGRVQAGSQVATGGRPGRSGRGRGGNLRRGMGRGLGMGLGRGRGGGMGCGVMPIPVPTPLLSGRKKQDVGELRQVASTMRQHLEEIERKIKALEEKPS